MLLGLSKKLILIVLVVISSVMAGGTAIWYLSHNPPRNNVKLDYSRNRTIQDAGNSVTINFRQCTADQRRIYVDFGSTFIQVIGEQKDGCLLRYGGEVENPNWNGELPFICRVPQSLGSISFRKFDYGVDLSAIQQYCVK